MITKIPITLLTGFLGSGKTTLLRQMLVMPSWKDTVVLVNELGEVGLDHHLLWGASDATLVLENGCICCSVRDDLLAVLEELFWKRLLRQIPYFTRVVIETTGLAEPGPIVAALMSHPLVAERYMLDGVLCTADAAMGERHLAQHRESVAQAACADTILVTKTDIVNEDAIISLEAALRTFNPLASIERTRDRQFSPEVLRLHTAAPLAEPAPMTATGSRYIHHHRVHTVTLRFTRPWQWDRFESALSATLVRHGQCILRIKGLIEVAGEDGPVVVQAVQETIFPAETLASWPGDKRNSFIVCISTGVTGDVIGEAFRSHMEPLDIL